MQEILMIIRIIWLLTREKQLQKHNLQFNNKPQTKTEISWTISLQMKFINSPIMKNSNLDLIS